MLHLEIYSISFPALGFTLVQLTFWFNQLLAVSSSFYRWSILSVAICKQHLLKFRFSVSQSIKYHKMYKSLVSSISKNLDTVVSRLYKLEATMIPRTRRKTNPSKFLRQICLFGLLAITILYFMVLNFAKKINFKLK